MNEDQLNVIDNGELESSELYDNEKEIAQKILSDLEGTLVVRAISILDFCSRAVKYTRFNPKSEEEKQNNSMDFERERRFLIPALGGRLDSVVDEITKQIKKCNIENSPTILNELFEYTAKKILTEASIESYQREHKRSL